MRKLSALPVLALVSAFSAAQVVDVTTPREEAARLAREARKDLNVRTATAAALAAAGIHVRLAPSRFDRSPNYYDAWAYRIWDRTFPYKELDPEAYNKAVEVRRSLPAPPRGGSEEDGGPAKIGGAGLWEFIGPKRLQVPYTTYYGPVDSYTSGRTGGIAFDPLDSNIIYKTGSAGGVWKTTDAGATWRSIGDGFPIPYAGPVAVSPANRNLVLVGTGDYDGGTGVGTGVMRSLDGGVSWEWVATTTIRNVNFSRIVFDPDVPRRVLATTTGGLYESLDDGLTWTRRNVAGSSSLNLSGISFAPSPGASRLWVLSSISSGAYGVFFSTDGGQNWTRDTAYPGTSGRTQIAASSVLPNTAYAVTGGQRKVWRGVYAPGDGFVWTDISAGFPNGFGGTDTYNWSQQSYDMQIATAPHTVGGVRRDTVYVGLITIASYDGATWTDIGRTYFGDSKTHNDQHNFAVSPSDPSKMAFGNDGGLYGLSIAADGTQTINARANGDSSLAMFYTAAWHPTNPTRMIGGTQDNASPVARGDLENWLNRTGGDGAGCAVDPRRPDIGFGSAQYQNLYKTTNGWNTDAGLRGSWPEGMPFIGRMAMDDSPEGYLYVGGNASLFRYRNSTNTWTDKLGGSPFNGAVRAISVAPSDPNVIYVGTTQSGLYVSFDRGSTWRRIGQGEISGSVTSVSVHPARPWEVAFTTGSGPSHVFRYADTRLATPVRNTISGSGGSALPDVMTSVVARNLDRPETDLYAATDVGVFGSRDGGATWFNMTEPLGLPPVEVSALEHTPGTGYLNAATYGRGMFRLRVDEIPTATTLKLALAEPVRNADGSISLRLTVRNTGTEAARQVRVTSAKLILNGLAALDPSASMPMTIGRIGVGATDAQNATYANPGLTSGRQGIATFTVTWLSGTETKTLTFSNRVRMP